MARHRGGYTWAFRLAALTGTVLLWPALASAEVVTDGTLGARVRLTGRAVEVPARLGQVRGQNLFHSFERFGVPTQGRVTFTGPGGLENVIGRVTGGERSEIHGTLASKVPGADLWLINPAGILFGPGARLDVPGAFHASTADELRFEDGAVFSALDPEGSVLSVAAPAAFGFLGAAPGPITVDRSVLEVDEGEALSLVGGDVAIRGNNDGIANDDGFADEPGTVRAKGGRVTLAALGGAGAVAVATGEATGAVTGAVRLSGEAAAVSTGDGGGAVRIRGGRVMVEDSSFVLAHNMGRTDAKGGVTVTAGVVELLGNGRISSDTFGSGDAGSVTVTTGRLLIVGDSGADPDNPSGIHNMVAEGARGRGGAVTVQAEGGIELRDSGVIISSTFGDGDGGAVTVTAGTIELDSASRIDTNSFASGTGDAGAVTVTATGVLELRDDSRIRSATFLGIGDGGEVTVEAGAIELQDASNIFSITRGTGDAGAVTVTATGTGTIELRDNSFIRSNTFGTGDAGVVTVEAGTVELDSSQINSDNYIPGIGDAGVVTVTADTIELRDNSFISSTSFGTGDAGAVTVTATGTIELRDDSGITNRTTGGDGDAGAMTITADTIEILNDSDITSNTGGNGDAGAMTITATGTIELRDGSLISSKTYGPGEAGRVRVSAHHAITVDGGTINTDSNSYISDDGEVYVSGAAGNVDIRTPRLVVKNGGLIGSSSTGFGVGDGGEEFPVVIPGSNPAGDVRLDAGTLEVENASIRTEGTGGKGGRITIIASDLIHLHDAEVTASGVGPEETSSVITLQAPLIALNDSRVTALTGDDESLEGSGLARLFGDVTIVSSDSEVAASSEVTLTGLENEVGSWLAVPEEGVFLGAEDLLREPCAARGRAGAEPPSRFTAEGRGGLPPDPAGPLAASYRAGEDGGGLGEGLGGERPRADPALRVVAAACDPARGG